MSKMADYVCSLGFTLELSPGLVVASKNGLMVTGKSIKEVYLHIFWVEFAK